MSSKKTRQEKQPLAFDRAMDRLASVLRLVNDDMRPFDEKAAEIMEAMRRRDADVMLTEFLDWFDDLED